MTGIEVGRVVTDVVGEVVGIDVVGEVVTEVVGCVVTDVVGEVVVEVVGWVVTDVVGCVVGEVVGGGAVLTVRSTCTDPPEENVDVWSALYPFTQNSTGIEHPHDASELVTCATRYW
jgi:hypothetical protein